MIDPTVAYSWLSVCNSRQGISWVRLFHTLELSVPSSRAVFPLPMLTVQTPWSAPGFVDSQKIGAYRSHSAHKDTSRITQQLNSNNKEKSLTLLSLIFQRAHQAHPQPYRKPKSSATTRYVVEDVSFPRIWVGSIFRLCPALYFRRDFPVHIGPSLIRVLRYQFDVLGVTRHWILKMSIQHSQNPRDC